MELETIGFSLSEIRGVCEASKFLIVFEGPLNELFWLLRLFIRDKEFIELLLLLLFVALVLLVELFIFWLIIRVELSR